jgi:metal-responsive CopG/Arc/MetJ family transcriptional regulator
MRQIRTISLPKEMNTEIDRMIREEGVSRSTLVREALGEYIYFRKLRKLRDKLIVKAQARGVYTENDVFRLVS